ncbi:hypothetical protein G4Y79_17835 [Phototrophicus methaneseepsis]|uniref:RNase H type-1 domain-containing protein n=1 Tax=Phototrophicus methaneseepsis TaxID=2710758 RepID=A0A7S8E710_9CHLR|nr:RNase H family protein [Phototrophicus methaneseepsis]QPC81536.1 hypothetical protein G4Y79_17835 [Phototrophicus methaneseepsis]
MPVLYEDKLRDRGLLLVRQLKDAGIKSALLEDSFRDYLVKLQIAATDGSDAGKLNLYYSPKRKEYTLKTHEMKHKKLASQIESLWHEFNGTEAQVADEMPTAGYVAYVDGAHIDGFVGYGAVVLHEGKEVARFSGRITEDTEARQVAGELMAAMTVLDWCAQEGVQTITIIYDYKGIEKWATGEWKTNQPLTKRYAAFTKKSPVKVTWHKVKSHTGVRWNEVADQLAKKGALQRF